MPNVTVPSEQEKALLLELGMGNKDYGVTRRDENALRLMCYATRDYIWIKRISSDDTNSDDAREPDENEWQILRENGINPDSFEVTCREAHLIEVRRKDTGTYLLILKGDRPW